MDQQGKVRMMKTKRKVIQGVFTCCAFFIIANLPFLTITHLFGIETFLDSFKYPTSYQYIKTEKLSGIDAHAGYLLLQCAAPQGVIIKEQETILYYTINDTVQDGIVYKIVSENGINRYYTTTSNYDLLDGPIYDPQVIGKIKGRFNDTIWNIFCVRIWDLSVDNLNAIALFTAS